MLLFQWLHTKQGHFSPLLCVPQTDGDFFLESALIFAEAEKDAAKSHMRHLFALISLATSKPKLAE